MLRYLVLVALVAAATTEKVSFENYKVFRIIPTSEEQLELLRQLEDVSGRYSFWSEPGSVNRPADLMVAPENVPEFVEYMNVTNTHYETYVENVQKLIDTENFGISGRSVGFGWTKYHTLDEIYAWLDSLEQQYPDYVEVVVGGKTYEGRDIKGVKLSFGEKKPGIFIEGGIHAREWISPATVTYLLHEFLTNQDPEVRRLAESHDWYMFPSVNPDGFVYTHTTDRLWRKTRSKHGLCKGVDANRNWGYKWNSGGASSFPCTETYAGKTPFSEIETRTLSKYIKSISDNLFAYIAFHSYSQLLLFSYGHTKEHLDNYDEQFAIGTKTIEALSRRYNTKYNTGNIAEAIYVATGSSMDYVKATYKLPIAYTYELRDTGTYGFLLPAKQIIPTGKEVLDSFLALFNEALKFGYPKWKN